MNWYTNTLFRIGDIKYKVFSTCEEISKIKNVKDVYIFGSFANHINDDNYLVKDIDIIAVTNFNQDDLLSINEGEYSPLSMKKELLAENGYSEEAVEFTKKYLNIKMAGIDRWVCSKNKSLLHWGFVPNYTSDWLENQKEIIAKTENNTKIKKENIFKLSNTGKKNWFQEYINNYNNEFKEEPTGWFAIQNKLSNIKYITGNLNAQK